MNIFTRFFRRQRYYYSFYNSVSMGMGCIEAFTARSAMKQLRSLHPEPNQQTVYRVWKSYLTRNLCVRNNGFARWESWKESRD